MYTSSARNISLPFQILVAGCLAKYTMRFWTEPACMHFFILLQTGLLTSFLLPCNYIYLINENHLKPKLTGGTLPNKNSRLSFRLTNAEGTAVFWPNNFLGAISVAFINLHFWVHFLLFSSHTTKAGLLKKQLGAYTKQFASGLTLSAS